MRPPLPDYPGSKGGSGVAKRIVSLMPPHRVYIEAFLGGGAVLRLKKPAALSIGLDLAPSVIAAWRPAATPGLTLQDCEAWHAGNGEADVRIADNGDADRHAILGEVGRASREASPGMTLGPSGTTSPDVALGSGLWALPSDPAITAEHAAPGEPRGNPLLEGPLCVAMVDALEWLASAPAMLLDPETLLYCDPPYLRSVRTRLFYDFELESPEAHGRLLELLYGLRCMVVLSHYPCRFYADRLRHWRQVSYRTMTRGGVRIECAWCNFPEPQVFHDPRFLGDGFRERERIKRRSTRWRLRFQGMSSAERQVVATALASVDRASLEAALQPGS